jgi:hypothetical protein
VPHDDTIIQSTPEKNVIKVATKKHKDKQLYRRENIKETDAIEGGRGARAGRGEKHYDKHLDKNVKNDRTRTAWAKSPLMTQICGQRRT